MKLRTINEALDEFEARELLIDAISKKFSGKDVVYHGSSDITYLNSVDDIDTTQHTKNAESKFFWVTKNAGTAVNYSKSHNGYGDKSGVAAFKLSGKKYTLTRADVNSLDSQDKYEKFFEQKLKEGYDYVLVPQDANNVVVLNLAKLVFIGKILNHEVLNQQ